MMAAIAAAEAGACVTILERRPQPGRKLLATGGGRCNLANTLEPEEYMRRFGPNGRFMAPALRNFGRDALLRFMAEKNVPCSADDGFHYFPASQRAADVLEALRKTMSRLNITQVCGETVTRLLITNGAVRGVATNRDELPADAVILATGSPASPGLGGSSLGAELAAQAGHSIEPFVPALAPIATRETWPTACAGVALQNASIKIDLPKHRNNAMRGNLLFTHKGLSGPIILDLSGKISRLLRELPEVPLRLCLLPDMTQSSAAALIQSRRQTRGRQSAHNLVSGVLPRSLASALCNEAGIAPETRAAQLSGQQQKHLASLLCSAPLTAAEAPDFADAMLAGGGVSLREINPVTLASRLLRGLYFAGELLNLDGPCGGFNLTWAFSSGRLAGSAAARHSLALQCFLPSQR